MRIVPSEEPVAEEVALIEGIPLDMSFQRRNVGLAYVLEGPRLLSLHLFSLLRPRKHRLGENVQGEGYQILKPL